MQLQFGAAANLYLHSEYQTFRRPAAKQVSPGSAVGNLHVNSSVQLEIKNYCFHCLERAAKCWCVFWISKWAVLMLSIPLGWSTAVTQGWLQSGQSSTFTPSACVVGQWPVVCFDSTGESSCEFFPFLVRYMEYLCFPSLLQLSTGKSLKHLSFHDFLHEGESLSCLENGEIVSLCSNLCRDTVTEWKTDPGFQQLKCFL